MEKSMIANILGWLSKERFVKERIQTMEDILSYYKIPFFIQNGKDSKNIIIQLADTNEKVTVIGAHYDVYPGSLGINDNGCSIAMLIKFCKTLLDNKTKENLEVVFFDKEETGMLGSRDYIQINKERIKEALIFDIIGYKDIVLASGSISKIGDMMFEHDVKLLKFGLPSDNLNFIREDIPVCLITGAAKSDVKDNKDYTYSVVADASFYKTFHNKVWDNQMTFIHFGLIEKIYTMLIDLYVS